MNEYELGYALRTQEIDRLRALSYSAYLLTDWWTHKRDQALHRAGGACELCGIATRWLEAHHTTYARMGCEQPDDLVALCPVCHRHVTDNGLARLPRADLLRRRIEILYSPEFQRTTAGEL